ncbi:MAG: ribosome maturation factor RimP [Acidimicrobiales bacterium]|nr:ribosome maturation factor RimP [Acidimicrobiales bacterium]
MKGGETMATVCERVQALVEPIVAELGLELFDVEHAGGVLKISVDRPGGVDLDALAVATRRISRALDQADPIPGRYTLEVSSPGLERNLRLPAHFAWARGKQVAVKTVAGFAGERRMRGVIGDSDQDGFELIIEGADVLRLSYDDVERVRTVFEWGAQQTPGTAGREVSAHGKKAKAS